MSSATYWKNLFGLQCGDEELQQISSPTLELNIHVLMKTVEAGTFLGSLVFAPLVTLARGPRNLAGLGERMIRFGRNGAFVGIPAGPAMTYAMITQKKLGEPEIYDRSYRLRCNKSQNLVDRSFLAATLPAAALFGATGFVLACNAAVIGGALTNNVIMKEKDGKK